MTAAAVNAEDAVRARARDEGRRAAWIAACADMSARGLVALIGGPTWPPARLTL